MLKVNIESGEETRVPHTLRTTIMASWVVGMGLACPLVIEERPSMPAFDLPELSPEVTLDFKEFALHALR
jgi:hypothetical protein